MAKHRVSVASFFLTRQVPVECTSCNDTEGMQAFWLNYNAAAKYELALGERSQFFAYGGPVGEAALGPTAFPHRAARCCAIPIRNREFRVMISIPNSRLVQRTRFGARCMLQ